MYRQIQKCGQLEKDSENSSWIGKNGQWDRREKDEKQSEELFIQKHNWSNVFQLLWGQNKYSGQSLGLDVAIEEI